jgi:hypothetical protein
MNARAGAILLVLSATAFAGANRVSGDSSSAGNMRTALVEDQASRRAGRFTVATGPITLMVRAVKFCSVRTARRRGYVLHHVAFVHHGHRLRSDAARSRLRQSSDGT